MDDETVKETLKIYVAQIIEVIENAYPDNKENKYARDWLARNVCHDILDDLDVEGYCGCRLCGS